MKRFRLWIPIILILVLLCGYLTFAFSDVPFVANLRRIYVETAMGTLRHQWLATSLLPESSVDKVMAQQQQARNKQIGVISNWEKDARRVLPAVTDRESFFHVYHELLPEIFEQWLLQHP